MKTNFHYAAFCVEASLSDDDLTQWYMLVPAGKINALDGRTFTGDSPELIVQNFAAGKVFLMVDLDHRSESKEGGGPAEGWVEKMEVREGAAWGRITWTPYGYVKIKYKEYRYLSPAFWTADGTDRIIKVKSVGMVNQPAILTYTLARQKSTKGAQMSTQETKTPAPPAKSEGQKTEAPPVVQTASRKDASQAPSLSLAVPRADHDAVVARAVAAEEALARHQADLWADKVEAAIGQAVKDGKIAPSSRDYHLAQCMRQGGFEEFKTYIASAPALLQPQKLPAAPVATGRKTMSSTEVRVARAMGVSRKDFLAERAAWEDEKKEASQNPEGETP